MSELKDQGKIRDLGVSNFQIDQMTLGHMCSFKREKREKVTTTHPQLKRWGGASFANTVCIASHVGRPWLRCVGRPAEGLRPDRGLRKELQALKLAPISVHQFQLPGADIGRPIR